MHPTGTATASGRQRAPALIITWAPATSACRDLRGYFAGLDKAELIHLVATLLPHTK